MSRAKAKIKHPNDSISLLESDISSNSNSSQATPSNLHSGSKMGGATPQFTPSLVRNTNFTEINRKNNSKTEIKQDNSKNYSQYHLLGSARDSKIATPAKKDKFSRNTPTFSKRNCRKDKYLNIVFPINKFLKCTENGCKKNNSGDLCLKCLQNHLYYSHLLTKIIPVYLCSISKEEIRNGVNLHPCFVVKKYYDVSTDGMDLEFKCKNCEKQFMFPQDLKKHHKRVHFRKNVEKAAEISDPLIPFGANDVTSPVTYSVDNTSNLSAPGTQSSCSNTINELTSRKLNPPQENVTAIEECNSRDTFLFSISRQLHDLSRYLLFRERCFKKDKKFTEQHRQ